MLLSIVDKSLYFFNDNLFLTKVIARVIAS